MIIAFVILYFVVGFLACLHLFATWDGYKVHRQGTVDNIGCFFLFCPEAGILALALWPVYLLVRICRLVMK